MVRIPEPGEASRPPAASGAAGPDEVSDWIVVGGGPHGVCAARALASQGATVRIVDPAPRLLHRWEERAGTVGMTWMRSPQSHHLDALPVALHHYLHRPENADVTALAGRFRRPLHAAFLRHSRDVIARHDLEERRVTGRVSELRPDRGHLRVAGEGFALRGRRVLIATGSNTPRVPAWARRLRRDGAPIGHAFEPDPAPFVDLIGSGISAVQRALLVRRRTGRTVRLWMRRPLLVRPFDHDQAWSRHRFLHSWARLGDAERWDFLERNPPRGSVPEGLAGRFDRAVRRGWIQVEEEIPQVERSAAEGRLLLRGRRRTVESEGITLVTGFEPETLPPWLRRAGRALDLPELEGLPRLGDDLEWGRGVHVSGPLARLRLGPVAGHLIGARWATSMLPGVRMQPA